MPELGSFHLVPFPLFFFCGCFVFIDDWHIFTNSINHLGPKGLNPFYLGGREACFRLFFIPHVPKILVMGQSIGSFWGKAKEKKKNLTVVAACTREARPWPFLLGGGLREGLGVGLFILFSCSQCVLIKFSWGSLCSQSSQSVPQDVPNSTTL